jgi:hypothetical protein
MKFAVTLRLDVQAEDASGAAQLFGHLLQQSGNGTPLVLDVTRPGQGTTFHKLRINGGSITTEKVG